MSPFLHLGLIQIEASLYECFVLFWVPRGRPFLFQNCGVASLTWFSYVGGLPKRNSLANIDCFTQEHGPKTYCTHCLACKVHFTDTLRLARRRTKVRLALRLAQSLRAAKLHNPPPLTKYGFGILHSVRTAMILVRPHAAMSRG